MHDFLLTHGLWTLGTIIFIDEIGLPFFPNGTALFVASTAAASLSELHVWKFFLIAIIAAQIGNTLLFFGGKHGLQKWIRHHDIRFLPSKERLDKFKRFFLKKHGWLTIIAFACITTIRPYSALIAGATGMSPWKFFPFHFFGIILWGSVVTLSGYYIGMPLLNMIKTYGYSYGAIIIIILAYWYFWSQFPWHYFRPKKK